jgi:hypothetical protein
VHGRDDAGRDGQVDGPAARLHHGEGRAGERLRGRGAEQDDGLRADEGQLGLDPRQARPNLDAVRALVQPALAGRPPLEVLDDVRHEGLLAVDARILECPIEQRARRPHERLAVEVLAVAGLLADEHQASRHRARAEHRLRRANP